MGGEELNMLRLKMQVDLIQRVKRTVRNTYTHTLHIYIYIRKESFRPKEESLQISWCSPPKEWLTPNKTELPVMGHDGEGEAMICQGWYEEDSGTRCYNFRII